MISLDACASTFDTMNTKLRHQKYTIMMFWFQIPFRLPLYLINETNSAVHSNNHFCEERAFFVASISRCSFTSTFYCLTTNDKRVSAVKRNDLFKGELLACLLRMRPITEHSTLGWKDG